MDLPDLPPDFTFPRLAQTAEAIDFTFEAKRAAMGPHIIRRWGWDEAVQREIHHRRFHEKPFFGINRDASSLGTLSFQVLTGYIQFGEFYLLPAFQRRGIGSAVLAHCLAVAHEMGLAVRLEHLLWNPVGSLYRRHGFAPTGCSETHQFMERPTPDAIP
ncbi:GNAT family N-acetyltransferase [Inquilinus sp.]|uniref:GNAT family N-acetyltransferase n=1 Tax=Inquilinus sp. TaxID=1932117 RepID=UPI0031DBDEC0